MCTANIVVVIIGNHPIKSIKQDLKLKEQELKLNQDLHSLNSVAQNDSKSMMDR